MDQIKIGKFIAEMRKENNLTQRQLAEELNISDKTVSKWECGKGLPEVSFMLPLCERLKITVNELLSGEKLSAENYQQKAEENMMNLVREKEENKENSYIGNCCHVMRQYAYGMYPDSGVCGEYRITGTGHVDWIRCSRSYYRNRHCHCSGQRGGHI